MKKTLLLLALVPFFASAQQFKFPKKTGTATVGITGTQIMIDQGEVAISDWFAFIYATSCQDDRLEDFSLLPDTNKMPEKCRYAVRLFLRLFDYTESTLPYSLYPFWGKNSYQKFYIPMTKEQAKGPDHNKAINELTGQALLERILDMPVTGITYEQAQQYLEWRTGLAQESKDIQKTGYKVKARMMTKEEWTKLANDAGPHQPENKTAKIDSANAEGCYMLKVKEDKPCKSSAEGIRLYGEGIVTIYSYFPDRLGLYNMFGNVAEMTQEKGVAMGGSYQDYASACDASKSVSFTGAQPWLGFRCVLEFYK
ncbi:MAG: SUMF1/EgtB/PvdO family nonheme iron enzyme [Bacteroidota bacterium]